ncbi:MAG: 30S ribosomal protein S14 [Fimbriimonadaceae bacterium]|nr:30S ribosomal protein S14 [Alphaproteobacteria bacterium]
MAKKSAIERDLKRRKMAKAYASRRARLKAIATNKSLPMEDRFKAQLALAQLPRNSSPNRARNRCVVTGRPRAYYRKLGMSRIALRDMASDGQIPGMVKASW